MDEVELLLGFPSGHTAVPLDKDSGAKRKLADARRWQLLANTWSVPCLRFFALCILFSSGVLPAASECAVAHVYQPWPGFSGDLPGVDVLLTAHGCQGADFVSRYLSSLHPAIASASLKYASIFDSPQSELNRFTAYREKMGHDVSGCWQPDTLEAEGRAGLLAAADAQTGAHLKRGAIPRLVPSGLSSSEHVEFAATIGDLPIDCPASLSLSKRFPWTWWLS